jgi:oligopeptide/dipeptide ABC transporter ATP-binding protein
MTFQPTPPPRISSTLLEVRDLSLSIGDAHPLRNVRLKIEKGRSLGIVGESGSGKSLTSLSIMGLQPDRARLNGKIFWKGQDLLQLDPAQRAALRGKEIAMIFQDPMSSLNPSYTVGFQIEEVLRLRLGIRNSVDRLKRGLSLLREVGIPAPEERWSAYPHQLSGGMSQRVCIAMALAGEPELLIADEPTTALDVTVQQQILVLLRSLMKERGMSLIFVTHDLAVAMKVCDDISVCYAGETVETDSAQRILQSPRHPYTAALLRSRPGFGQNVRTRLASIGGAVPQSTAKIVGCSFAERCEKVSASCRLQKPPAYEDSLSFVRCILYDQTKSGVEL